MARLLLLVLIAALSGCASHLSQEQCTTMNWFNEGMKDGTAGNPMRDLTKSAEDCGRFGLKVNAGQYQTGWRQGAKQYCTPDSNTGYADGAAGKSLSVIYDRMPICLQAKTKLNLGAYTMGRAKGLQTFCSYENGVNFARQGKSLTEDICPANLKAKFNAGWAAGKEQFCNNSENGFSLGKNGNPYPELCKPEIYVSFKSEYDRGVAISQRIRDLQTRVDALNDRISSKVNEFLLDKKDDGFYKLDLNTSKDAEEAVASVNSAIRDKQPLESELFSLQVMK